MRDFFSNIHKCWARLRIPGGLIIMAAVTLCVFSGNSGFQDLTIDVMSFNIRYANPHDGENRWEMRKDLVCDVIRGYAPDVAGLQEALRSQLDQIRLALPEYTEVGEGRDGGTAGEYSAILYKSSRFELDTSGTFWLSDTPEEPSRHWGNACVRICTWARLIEKNSGKGFYLFNTHLDHVSQESREKSVRLIMRRIAGRIHQDPYMLTGDFNAGESNPAIEFLTGFDGPKLMDTFRVVCPDAGDAGTFNGWNGRTDGEKIDYIFVSSGVHTIRAGIVRSHSEGHYPSDHFPVTARVKIR
jgi:endonuclease/exonuclease/phosphatase family metal-dependent hydrolase